MRSAGSVLALSTLLLGVLALPPDASAQRREGNRSQVKQVATPRAPAAAAPLPKPAAAKPPLRRAEPAAARTAFLSCVPYARMVTNIQVSGNGGTWWHNAAGAYDRGHRPEAGSVLVFRATGGMSRGHVAVVEREVGPREITIHHANWEGPGIRKGTVTRDVSVVDVSPSNDWTAVRVQAGLSRGAYGRVYPTFGFVHDRPSGFPAPRGAMTASLAPGGVVELAEATAHARFIGASTAGLGPDPAR